MSATLLAGSRWSTPGRAGLIALGAGLLAATIASLGGPTAVLLIGGGLIALAATIYAPGVVLALLLLVPYYKGTAQPYVPVDLTVVFAGLNLVQLVFVLRDRRSFDGSVVGFGLWGALGLALIAGVLYAPDQALAVDLVVRFMALLFLPITVAVLRVSSSERHVRDLLFTTFALALVITALGLFSLSATERLEIPGADTITLGRAALLVPIIGLTFIAHVAPRPIWWLTALLFPLALIVAVASGSRGPLLVTFLMAVAGTIIHIADVRTIDWRRARVILALAIGCIVLLGLAGPFLPVDSLQRFSLLVEFVQGDVLGDSAVSSDYSSDARVNLFDAALAMFGERPITGYGPGGFEVISGHVLGPGEPNAYPHNAVFQFAAEFGLIGLSIFIGMIAIGIWRPLPRLASTNALRIVFVFFLLNAMVSGDIFDDRMTWGLLVLLLALGRHVGGTVPSATPRAAPALAGRPLEG